MSSSVFSDTDSFLCVFHAEISLVYFFGVGESPSGKAGAFEAPIPWFESMLPSHEPLTSFGFMAAPITFTLKNRGGSCPAPECPQARMVQGF